MSCFNILQAEGAVCQWKICSGGATPLSNLYNMMAYQGHFADGKKEQIFSKKWQKL